MSQVFSNAAIERIARVVNAAAGWEAIGAADFVDLALELNLHERLGEIEANALFGFWYGDDLDPALRFVSFAGFLELGIQSGYVSLGEWEGVPALKEALSAFLARGAEAGAVDLRLLDALYRRLGQPDLGPRSSTDVTFASFESYLHLTSRVRADDAVLAFVDETHRHGNPTGGKDRSALLSPRHFAEAFATGAIAGVTVTDVAAGVRLLGYFDWLAEILEPLALDSELRAGIVRHARWAQGAARVQGRFGLWADQMAEWAERPAEARADWSARAERLFGRLAAEQERQGAAGKAPAGEEEQPENEETVVAGTEVETSLEERVDQLVAEGRVAAARELVLEEAAQQLKRLRPAAPDWIERVEALVTSAQWLVNLGNGDAAAALIAQVVPTLIERHGRSGYKVVADALEIVDRARRGAPQSQQEEQAPAPAVRYDEPLGVRAAAEPDYRAFGEST